METGSGYKYRTEIAFVVAFCKVLHAVMFHFSEFCLFLFHWIALLVCICFADGFVLMCRIAGSVSSAATCPLDVAKTRLQSSLIAAGHMQVRPTLNVAGGGYAATLHASLSQPRCARPTVSIGFYHCIRWKDIFVFVPDGLIYYHWQLLLFTLCALYVEQGLWTGADLGFYKGGCPIHLKGAPEVEHRRSNIFPSNDPLFSPLIVHISAHVLI